MKKPTFDSDGYPTEETLETIKNWDSKDGFRELLRFVETAWKWGDAYVETLEDKDENTIILFHTVGWSGNEDLIFALKQNTLFWSMCWQESRRGGHYRFSV